MRVTQMEVYSAALNTSGLKITHTARNGSFLEIDHCPTTNRINILHINKDNERLLAGSYPDSVSVVSVEISED